MTAGELCDRFVSAVGAYQQASKLRERLRNQMALGGDSHQPCLAARCALLDGVLKQQERAFLSLLDALESDLGSIDNPQKC